MKNSGFSLSVDSIIDLIDESETQISVSRSLVEQYILERSQGHLNMLLCECFAINVKIMKTLESALRVFEEPLDEEPEDETAEQVVFSDRDMALIETLLLARFYLNAELLQANISVQLH